MVKPVHTAPLSHQCSDRDFLHLCEKAKVALNVSQKERMAIELETRNQSSTSTWHAVRAKRVTGSKCGKILKQKHAVALLKSIMYGQPFITAPKPIKWGRDNEPVACNAYVEYMKRHGHPDLWVENCGFVIHPEFGWLGASPDGRVTDPSSNSIHGIVEFKCPYSKREMFPQEACGDSDFYCHLTSEGNLQLKREHLYYHQVQLQLHVCLDLAQWCDFCIYTPKGILVERILPDSLWWDNNIPKLENYFDRHMLPEIVCPHYKPGHIL